MPTMTPTETTSAADTLWAHRLAQRTQGVRSSVIRELLKLTEKPDVISFAHVPKIRRVYRERRDAMLAAMDRHIPREVSWTRPQGGLFLWATLPPGLDSAQLLQEALERKVAFVPGAAFFPRGGGAGTIRLNLSYCTPERIEEGIRRLGEVLKSRLARPAGRNAPGRQASPVSAAS